MKNKFASLVLSAVTITGCISEVDQQKTEVVDTVNQSWYTNYTHSICGADLLLNVANRQAIVAATPLTKFSICSQFTNGSTEDYQPAQNICTNQHWQNYITIPNAMDEVLYGAAGTPPALTNEKKLQLANLSPGKTCFMNGSGATQYFLNRVRYNGISFPHGSSLWALTRRINDLPECSGATTHDALHSCYTSLYDYIVREALNDLSTPIHPSIGYSGYKPGYDQFYWSDSDSVASYCTKRKTSLQPNCSYGELMDMVHGSLSHAKYAKSGSAINTFAKQVISNGKFKATGDSFVGGCEYTYFAKYKFTYPNTTFTARDVETFYRNNPSFPFCFYVIPPLGL